MNSLSKTWSFDWKSPGSNYSNKIKYRIVFKIKPGYKFELSTPETMKLLGSTKKDFDKDQDEEIVPKLETVEVVLVHCNLVKNGYQHTSKVLFSFVPDKQFKIIYCIKTRFNFWQYWAANKYFTKFFNDDEHS